MQLHLDALGGIAGDMFIAALLDAFPDQEQGVLASISACSFATEVECRLLPHNDGVLQGRRFVVREHQGSAAPFGSDRADTHTPHNHADGHLHHRDEMVPAQGPSEVSASRYRVSWRPVSWRKLRSELACADIEPEVKRHAIGIFTLLADAEARVHGVASADVAFHETGAWDSIADIVGAAHLIAALGATCWTIGPVPLGSGCIRTSHGIMPVPAPATTLLLEGFATVDDGVPGERVTPTGAAILRHLCLNSMSPAQPRVLRRSGVGFGTKTFPGLSNCLRVMSFEEQAAPASEHRELSVIEFEVDDQTGEDVAVGLERLRAHEGVFDVVQAPVFGKKGRMMIHVRLLSRPACLDDVAAACFRETTTIGLRHHTVRGEALRRCLENVQVGGRTVQVKTVERPGGRTAKAESDDVAEDSHAERSRLRRDAETLALARERIASEQIE